MVMKSIMKTVYSAHFSLVTGALLLFSHDVMAQNVGTVMNNITANTGTIPTLFTSLSYITGVGFTIMCLVKMRDYVDNPSQNFMKDALARLGIGAALILLPFAIQVAANTVGGAEGVAIARPVLYQ